VGDVCGVCGREKVVGGGLWRPDKCDPDMREEHWRLGYDRLRTALTEVNDLLMSVPPGEDWRAVVREKVVTALFGEPGWKDK
jgi:hypothetical protein